MVLVDSSLWIPILRERGAATEREQVTSLIRSGEAAWCASLRLDCGVEWVTHASENVWPIFSKL